MAPILIVTDTQKKTQKYLEQFYATFHIDPVHVFRIEAQNKEISIDQVREVKKQIAYLFAESRLFVFYNFDTASYQAQNALLKTLEEHNPNVYFVLITSNLYTILPTIRSRCTIVNLKKSMSLVPINADINQALDKLIKKNYLNLQTFSATNSSDALSLLAQFLSYFRMRLDKDPFATDIIRKLLSTRSLIMHNNINPQLAIDHFLIVLRKTYSEK